VVEGILIVKNFGILPQHYAASQSGKLRNWEKFNIEKLYIFIHNGQKINLIRECNEITIKYKLFFSDRWKNKLESYQDWYQENENLKSDETKRRGAALDRGTYFGLEGSFRKLNID